jgi:hypothetical protein
VIDAVTEALRAENKQTQSDTRGHDELRDKDEILQTVGLSGRLRYRPATILITNRSDAIDDPGDPR